MGRFSEEERRRLAEEFLPEITRLAKIRWHRNRRRMREFGIEVGDLVGWGCERFLEAIDGFDPSKGEFRAYICFEVMYAFGDAIRDKGPLVRTSRWARKVAARDPETLGVRERATVAGSKAATSGAHRAGEGPRGAAKFEESLPTTEGRQDAVDARIDVETLLATVSPLRAQYLRARFGIGDDTPRSFAEVGAMFGRGERNALWHYRMAMRQFREQFATEAA